MEGTFKVVADGREMQVSLFELWNVEASETAFVIFENGKVNHKNLNDILTGFFEGGPYVGRISGFCEGDEVPSMVELEYPSEEFEAVLEAMPE